MTVKAVSAKSVTTFRQNRVFQWGSLQIAHCNSSSTSLTKSSSYPPSDGVASASAILSQYGCLSVIAKWKKWDLVINQIMLAVSHMIIVPDMTSLLLFQESEPWRSIVYFNNRTETSVDDGARQSNSWFDQSPERQIGHRKSRSVLCARFPVVNWRSRSVAKSAD